MSASEIIEDLAFSKDSFLLGEFENLFPALFDDYPMYIEILRIIAKSREGVGKKEILTQLNHSQDGEQGLDKLQDLEESGFIKSFKPHFHKRKGIFYRLIDEYTAFYFSWLEPIKETLHAESLEKGNWNEMQVTPKWNSWLGYVFESICYKHIRQIRKALSISPAAIANSWRYVPRSKEENGAQIDLLFDRLDDAVTMCEIKYSDKPFIIDKAYAKNLKNKCDVFSTVTRSKKQIFITMVAASGVEENLYFDDLVDGVVTLDDLFN